MRCGEMAVAALSAALQRRELSAREAAQDCLRAIEERGGGVGAFLTVAGELALRQADEVAAARASGRELPPLAGVPMAVKDNICTEGVRTTCASRMLESFVPPYSAAVYERLRAQHYVSRLRAEKPARVYVLLDLLHVGACKALQSRKALEQRGRYLVHALVGALSGETHGKQQLIVFSKVKRALGQRIFVLQP